ncbi:MAG: PKD domain-containing protein, partial [Bacteroidota bacterium]
MSELCRTIGTNTIGHIIDDRERIDQHTLDNGIRTSTGIERDETDIIYSWSLVSWDWDFGDGNSSTLQNPQHTYAQPGVYDVGLITLNASGCPDTIIKSVLVDSLPIVNYVA